MRRLKVSPGVLSAALTVAGFGALCAAAWCVSRPLGLATIGVALLAVDYLSRPEKPNSR